MSARRIVLRLAYRDQVPSRLEHAALERECAQRGLPRPDDRITFQQWLRSKAPLRPERP